jgi:hypothetical protein
VKFSNADEFELHVHKCFNRMFELLMKVDSTVKQGAEREEESGDFGVMSDMRDWVEEIILHCHLAWQYHRLSKGPANLNTWDHVDQPKNKDEN